MNRKLRNTTAALLLLFIGSTAVAANDAVPPAKKRFSASLTLKPAFVSAKRSAVRLYPNPTSTGTVKVTTNLSNETVHFYVFDLESVLISQAVLKDKSLHTVSNLKKGVYLYEVFKKDESIEQGQIIVK